MKLTISTKTIDLIIAGMMAKPPITGPQLPRIRPPNHEPIRPATILPIILPGMLHTSKYELLGMSNNREKIPLNKERLFVYNKEQTFFIKELFQWIMGSYQTESLFVLI
jgi:hypothetical protein